jgi:hypothetical protein
VPVDLSKSLAAVDQDSTLIVVIEMSQSSWLVGARPGPGARPTEEAGAGPGTAVQTDRLLARGVVAAGRLVRLRGEADHCSMAAIPPLAEEDAKRATRERESRVNALSRLVNRLKGVLARPIIRGFNPKLRKVAE